MGANQETKINGEPIATFYDAEKIISLKLVKKTQISPNTGIFRFQLPSENHIVGLKPGQHIKMHFTASFLKYLHFLKNSLLKVDGEKISRKFTHVNDDDLIGFVDFLVKIYHPNVHPDFPLGGKFTPHLDTMKLNETLEFSGPVGRIVYKQNGNFKVREKGTTVDREVQFKKLAMIAGGSGITPLWQVINAVLKDPNDKTEMWLLFANQTPKDVLMKNYFDQMAAEHPDRFHVWYTVNRPDGSEWNYSTGYINEEMLSVYLPAAKDDVGVLLCGPKPMKNHACLPNLTKLGFSKEQLIIF